MVGFYSGFGKTLYNIDDYKPTGFAPIGIRGAIGNYGIQLGLDYNTNIVDPSFDIHDPVSNELLYTNTIKDNYLGAMLRFHMGDQARDVALILRGGIGYFFSKQTTTYSNLYLSMYPYMTNSSYKFANSIGYNGALGFSIPLPYNNIHINLEGQFNYNPRKYYGVTNYYSTWCVEIGLSYNFFHIYDLGHY